MAKKVLSLLLSIVMLLSVIAGLDFSALASAGKDTIDMQLIFNPVYNGNGYFDYSQTLGTESCFESSMLKEAPLTFAISSQERGVSMTGSLVLEAEKTIPVCNSRGKTPLKNDRVLGVGDYFSVTVLFDGATEIVASQQFFTYSSNIEPAGFYSKTISGSTVCGLAGKSDSDYKYVKAGGESGIASMSAEGLYPGVDDGILGNMSEIDTSKNLIKSLNAMQIGDSNVNSIDVSSISQDNHFTNPETGEIDYCYENRMICNTFVFKIIKDGDLTFSLYDPYNTKEPAFGAAFLLPCHSVKGNSDYITYAINADTNGNEYEGSRKLTFMGYNVNGSQPAIECKHIESKTVIENSTPANCTTGGYYENVVYCIECGEELSRQGVNTTALGHRFVDSEQYCQNGCGSMNTSVFVVGKCGRNVNYEFNKQTKVLRIFGSGDMWDKCFSSNSNNVSDSNIKATYNIYSLIDKVIIEDGVTNISCYSFENCSLTSISIPSSVSTIEESFLKCKKLKSLVIPSGTKTIADFAFQGCIELTNLSISETVNSIGEFAFNNCSNMSSIVVDENNPYYDSRNDCDAIIDSTTNTLIYGCKDTVIPNTVTGIGQYAFSFNSNVSKMNIPDSVQRIGGGAFYACKNLSSIAIPEGVTAIEVQTFADCTYLNTIHIPKSVTEVGSSAFSRSGLTDVYYAGTREEWNKVSINNENSGNGKLLNATMHFQEHIHSYSQIDYKAPTCTEKGYTEYSCECGDSYFSEISALGHTEVIDEAVSPTHTSTGLTEGKHCSVCNQILVEQTVVEAVDSIHAYSKIIVPPTCEKVGYRMYFCEDCGNSYIDKYYAVVEHKFKDGDKYCIYGCKTVNPEFECEHNWVLVSKTEANCIHSGRELLECSLCNDEKVEVISITEHSFVSEKHDSTPNKQGYTKYTCPVCEYSYVGDITPYATDKSVLNAAIKASIFFEEDDFSSNSYSIMKENYENCMELSNEDVPQVEIDNAIADLLEAQYGLEAYLNLNVFAKNGVVTNSTNSNSVLYGTDVTLTATSNTGYKFAGWYEKTSQRIMSTDAEYTFSISTNLDLEARFIPVNSATLTFANASGQIISTIDKTTDEWELIYDIASVAPAVPYSYGKENGKWNYDENTLAILKAGNDTTVTAVYDVVEEVESDALVNDSDIVPVAELRFDFNEATGKGSFIMSANIPENCKLNSVGVAFYQSKVESFNPTEMLLTLNNKNIVSQFNIVEKEDVYIVNTATSGRKWASVGYITYFNEYGELTTFYTNQVNVINNEWIR